MEFQALDALTRPNPTVRDYVIRAAAWATRKGIPHVHPSEAMNYRVAITVAAVEHCNVDCILLLLSLSSTGWERLIKDVRCAREWAISGEWRPE